MMMMMMMTACRWQHVLCRGVAGVNGTATQYVVNSADVCATTMVPVPTAHWLPGSTQ